MHFDRSDSEANQAVIDREFALLTRYLNSPLQQKAWQRYYRMIYRDSIARCRHLALMLEKELIEVDKKGKMPAAEKFDRLESPISPSFSAAHRKV